MSDVKCEICKFYNPYPLVEMEGECNDHTKIIYVSGNPVNNKPSVFKFSSCSNHEPIT